LLKLSFHLPAGPGAKYYDGLCAITYEYGTVKIQWLKDQSHIGSEEFYFEDRPTISSWIEYWHNKNKDRQIYIEEGLE
jgi:hypothetical protein